MAITVVEQMENSPGTCIGCGTNPKGPDGNELPAIHFEGIDVDWGNDVYICAECTTMIGRLMDWVPPEEHKALQKDYRHLNKEHGILERKLGKLRTQIKTIKAGEKAKKELA